MRRIGLYLRVSTEEQARITEGSLVSQKARLREYVAGHNRMTQGWGQIIDSYTDEKSAKDTNRPELQRMISDVRAGRINLILVTELSRLSRSIKDFCELWELLKDYNSAFITLKENFDTTNAAGEMMVFNLINLAQFERKQTAERISANWLSRAKRGLWNGGSIPLGFNRNDKNKSILIPNPIEAKVVETVFKLFLETGSVRQTCRELTKLGLKSKEFDNKYGEHRGGGQFTVMSVYKILTNKAYIGMREFNKSKAKTEIVKAAWDAIIDEKIFCEVQERLTSNKNRYKPQDWKTYAYPLKDISADLFYDKIKSLGTKLDSLVVSKKDLELQSSKMTDQSVDRLGLIKRLTRTIDALEKVPKEDQRPIFSNVIHFAEMHPMKVRLGLYAPTGSDFKSNSRFEPLNRGGSTTVSVGAPH